MPDFDKEISSFGYIDPGAAEGLSDSEHKAYIFYNRAIDDIKAGIEDIAFIKLKKAVSAKPDLYDAKLLIGLYNAKIGNGSKALDIFEDIIRSDKNKGETALKYIRMLNVDRDPLPAEVSDKETKKTNKKVTGRNLQSFLFFIFGVIVCLPTIFLFNNNKAPDNTSSAISSQEKRITDLLVEIDGNEQTILNLESENEELRNSADNETISYTLPDAEKEQIEKDAVSGFEAGLDKYLAILDLYNKGSFLEAADGIIAFAVSDTSFTELLGVRYNTFYSEAMNKAARYCEDRGVALYEAKRYDESLAFLGKTEVYKQNYQRMYRVIYYTGKDLLAKGEYEAAKEKFLEVIKIAPNNDWVVYANMKLNEIKELTKND